MKLVLLVISAVFGVKLVKEDQTKYSDEGRPFHGIVGWDDLEMKPT